MLTVRGPAPVVFNILTWVSMLTVRGPAPDVFNILTWVSMLTVRGPAPVVFKYTYLSKHADCTRARACRLQYTYLSSHADCTRARACRLQIYVLECTCWLYESPRLSSSNIRTWVSRLTAPGPAPPQLRPPLRFRCHCSRHSRLVKMDDQITSLDWFKNVVFGYDYKILFDTMNILFELMFS